MEKTCLNTSLTNWQLTYLLQYSLGGNSKTLMFVMVSPLQAHLSETLTSLKFATKVRFLLSWNQVITTNQIIRCITLTLEPRRGKQRSRIRNHEYWICPFLFTYHDEETNIWMDCLRRSFFLSFGESYLEYPHELKIGQEKEPWTRQTFCIDLV